MAVKTFDFDDDELDGLFRPQSIRNRPPPSLAPSADVRALGRTLFADHLEVLAGYVRASLHGAGPAPAAAATAAVDALARLFEATEDAPMHDAMADLRALIDEDPAAGTRARDHWRLGLRAWTELLAEALDAPHDARFRALVDPAVVSAPLLHELRSVRGIGPRRISRLYCAGLYTVDAVAAAPAEEISAVSGIPQALCEDVRVATHSFEAQRKLDAIESLEDAASSLRALLDRFHPKDVDLLIRARRALTNLEHALARTPAGGGR